MNSKKINYFKHHTVEIDKRVKIGKNTKIWHWSHISDDVIIGSNCILGQNIFIGKKVSIGSNVKIQNNVSIFSGVTIKKNSFIGPSVVFTNVLRPRAFINQKNKYLKTIIGSGCTMGANSTIVCGNNIGNYAFIGSNTLVNKEILPFGLYVGNPAKRIGWVSMNGAKLNLPTEGHKTTKCPVSKVEYILKKDKIFTKDKILI